MSDSLWQRLIRGRRRLIERADWVRLAGPDWAERIMQATVTDRFHAKQGRSTGRWVLQDQAGQLAVYLKRHYELPWWRGWLAALWPNAGWSPALQEWHHLERARTLGVPVPATVAAGELIGPWGRLQSFLAVEELAGMLPLNEAIPVAAEQLKPRDFAQWKRGLIREVVRLTRLLHDGRWFHKDLYLCHFFIRREDLATLPHWHGRVFLIDLHRMAHHPWTWRFWQIKDLAQLLYSSEVAGLTARDRVRFWRNYVEGRKSPGQRWPRWLILLKWRRYRQHNLKKAQRRAALEQSDKGVPLPSGTGE